MLVVMMRGLGSACQVGRTAQAHGHGANFPLMGACGTADNAVQGCTAGTWQDETGDGWTCLGIGSGTDASCGGTGTFMTCIPTPDPLGGLSNFSFDRQLPDGTFDLAHTAIAGLPNCDQAMVNNGCPAPHHTGVGGSICCTGMANPDHPDSCPPSWALYDVSGHLTNGVCGTQDQPGVSGCLFGMYEDIAGPTWRCLGIIGGSDVTCP